MKKFILVLAVCACGILQAQNKYALLVGIDDYKHEKISDLSGCKNDVRIIENLLQKNFEFLPDNITMLVDQEAEAQNIKQQLQKLVENAEENNGATIVIYFSGHGSQVTDTNGDESDGKDEILVTHSTQLVQNDEGKYYVESDDKIKDNYVADDYLQEILQKLETHEAHVTVIFDCCHSGTATRDLEKESKQLRLAVAAAKERGQDRPAPPGTVFISACRPEQVTTEHEFENGEQGGLLTYHIVEAIEHLGKRGDGEITYQNLFNHIHKKYQSKRVGSTPMIEGNMGKVLFASKCKAINKGYVVKTEKVRRSRQRRITINRGSFAGVTKGSIFAISNDTLCFIDKVNPLTSEGYQLNSTDEELQAYKDYLQEYITKMPSKAVWPSNEKLENDRTLLTAEEIVHARSELNLKLYVTNVSPADEDFFAKESKLSLSRKQLKNLSQDLYSAVNEYVEKDIVKVTNKRTRSHAILYINGDSAELYWNEGYYTDFTGRIRFPSTGEASKKKLQEVLRRFNKIRNLLQIPSSTEDLVDTELRSPKGKRFWSSKEVVTNDKQITNTWPLQDEVYSLCANNDKVVYAYPRSLIVQNINDHTPHSTSSAKKIRAISANQSQLVYTTNKNAYILNYNDQKIVHQIKLESRAAKKALAFSKNYLAVGHNDATISVYKKNNDAYELIHSIETEEENATQIAISANEKTLAFVEEEGESIYVWDMQNKKSLDTIDCDDEVLRIHFSGESLHYATKKTIHRYTKEKSTKLFQVKNRKYIRQIAFHENYIATLHDRNLNVYEISTQKWSKSYPGSFSSDNLVAITGVKNKEQIAVTTEENIHFYPIRQQTRAIKEDNVPSFTDGSTFSIELQNNTQSKVHLYMIFINSDFSIESQPLDTISANGKRPFTIEIPVPQESLFHIAYSDALVQQLNDKKLPEEIQKRLSGYYTIEEIQEVTSVYDEEWSVIYKDNNNIIRHAVILDEETEKGRKLHVKIKRFGKEWIKIFALSTHSNFFSSDWDEGSLTSIEVKKKALEEDALGDYLTPMVFGGEARKNHNKYKATIARKATTWSTVNIPIKLVPEK
ncbi:caspase family protein [Candidatus Uabimicrobium amorphum]|uniref:Peptidase C14 n=1 Tax=Uabimicrobium amorphum TaxID=2596890 RepID=A0A5S9IQJ3_UABAM|nr:caspase family protein [Candidatus Uabimicrobium amorphum]BBM86239.1 peptidase C14 [Candidatus Uabimicrobium amorphum]